MFLQNVARKKIYDAEKCNRAHHQLFYYEFLEKEENSFWNASQTSYIIRFGDPESGLVLVLQKKGLLGVPLSQKTLNTYAGHEASSQ